MDFGIASVAAITVIVYIVGMLVKASPLADKWIPSICGVVGGALGIASMFVMPEFPAQDVISAFAVGIVSGLASTGADQMVKQMRKEE
jgi:hypothetical protein